MAKLEHGSISKRTVEALSAEKDTVFWDGGLKGFGVRVYPSGSKVYVVQSRGPGGPKRVTVGRHGVISAGQARRRAALILARIKAGENPVPKSSSRGEAGPTIAGLAERYLREHVDVRCKPSTRKSQRQVVGKYILPALGRLPVSELERRHVGNLHAGLHKSPGSANEAVATLSRILNKAEAWGLVPPGSNPCRFVKKYRRRRLERFLTGEEFRRLGRVLSALEAEGKVPPHAAAALRLLMLTGCRLGEILTLRWEDVHPEANEIRLRDSKTGPWVVPLSPAAARVLAGLPRPAETPWVIAGRKPGTRLAHIHHHWYRVRERAGLEDVRIHDLRHSFASRALALGESLPMIGKLLGHSKIRTTARYAHLARDSVKVSAARVAASIGADLSAEGRGADVRAAARPRRRRPRDGT